MEPIDISYLSLGIGLLLSIIPLYYLWKYKTNLVRATSIAIFRMVVQLFLVGAYMKYLFEWNSPWLTLLWVTIMMLVATDTAVVRTQLKRKLLFFPICIGLITSVATIGLFFLSIVLNTRDVFSARYFIPIFGTLMGNVLSSNVIALNTYYQGLHREKQLYYYLLGNGATLEEARSPFISQALVKAFSPLIANMAVMGLVALPGTMIGQILGGSSPNVAIKYQMMIIIINFAASVLSLMITIRLSSNRTFDEFGVLTPVLKK